MAMALVAIQGCGKEQSFNKNSSPPEYNTIPAAPVTTPLRPTPSIAAESSIPAPIAENELDFEVKNMTGRRVYVVCFSYIRKQQFVRWHWSKSPIYQLDHGEKITVDVDTIADEPDRKHVFGYLGLFDSYQEADDAIYELLDEEKTVDLDLLYKLKNQTVVLNVEKYGFKGELLNYDFVKKDGMLVEVPELDFVVENQSGRTLYITCFVYQQKPRHIPWRFDKTPVIKLEPGEEGIIDVDPILHRYDRKYTRGHLGVFDTFVDAEHATYEMLAPEHKVGLGPLDKYAHKKIILHIEQYGVKGDLVDYAIKKTKHKKLSTLEDLDPHHHKIWR